MSGELWEFGFTKWASKLRLKWKVCEFWRLQQLKSVDKLITLILSELYLPRVCSNSPANGAQGGRAALVTDALLRDKQRKLTKGTICQVKEPVSVATHERQRNIMRQQQHGSNEQRHGTALRFAFYWRHLLFECVAVSWFDFLNSQHVLVLGGLPSKRDDAANATDDVPGLEKRRSGSTKRTTT